MINFEQYLAERTGSVVSKEKRKVTEIELRQMIANKDTSIADVDVSEIKDMSNLFRFSDFGGSWTADLSEWDTSKVVDMESMFDGCTNLKEVSLPHTENVTNMNGMFWGCTKLKEVSLPHTENVENMESMFRSCTSLKEVTLPNTGNVTDMSSMFRGCRSLLQDFSSWDITNVNKKSDMFKGCTKMEEAYKNNNKLYPKGYE